MSRSSFEGSSAAGFAGQQRGCGLKVLDEPGVGIVALAWLPCTRITDEGCTIGTTVSSSLSGPLRQDSV